jgi:hypothetical protein
MPTLIRSCVCHFIVVYGELCVMLVMCIAEFKSVPQRSGSLPTLFTTTFVLILGYLFSYVACKSVIHILILLTFNLHWLFMTFMVDIYVWKPSSNHSSWHIFLCQVVSGPHFEYIPILFYLWEFQLLCYILLSDRLVNNKLGYMWWPCICVWWGGFLLLSVSCK